MTRHSHELASFNLLIEGSYTESYGSRRFECDPLTVLWCPPAVVHSNKFGDSGGRIFYVELSRNSLDLLRDHSPIPDSFSTRGPAIVSLAIRARKEFEDWQAHSPVIVEGLIWEMLGAAARPEKANYKRPPRWLVSVFEGLNEGFSRKVSVKNIADQAGVHPVHLAAVFRQFKRQTVGDYVQDLRVNFAAELLCNSEMPLSEIAASAGFADQSHFTRVFKSRTQTTPGIFRKLAR